VLENVEYSKILHKNTKNIISSYFFHKKEQVNDEKNLILQVECADRVKIKENKQT
jgi:hypothetical protein